MRYTAVRAGTAGPRRIRRCLLEIPASLRSSELHGRAALESAAVRPTEWYRPQCLSLRALRSKARQSRSTGRSTGKPRRSRRCLLEIAASAFGLLAMTRVGGARKFVPASLRKRQVPRLVIARLRRSRGAGLPAGKGREPSPYQRRFLHFPSFPHFLQDVKRFRHGAQIMGPLFGGSMHCGARQDMLQFMVLR